MRGLSAIDALMICDRVGNCSAMPPFCHCPPKLFLFPLLLVFFWHRYKNHLNMHLYTGEELGFKEISTRIVCRRGREALVHQNDFWVINEKLDISRYVWGTDGFPLRWNCHPVLYSDIHYLWLENGNITNIFLILAFFWLTCSDRVRSFLASCIQL